ncbi:MAG: hypothetical protein M1819_002822 [Sarea resinae]|nr:MAG: hypothetical protein M1819_002822 [Sarea resinae]
MKSGLGFRAGEAAEAPRTSRERSADQDGGEKAAGAQNGTEGEGEEEEDDYMSMAIVEPTGPPQKETYTQRRIRKQREAEIRGRPKSKKELEAEAAAAREAGLARSLLATDSSNKGLRMMKMMGYSEGGALGRPGDSEARTVPLGVEIKEGRGGIGLDNEKKRKIREEWAREEKRTKVEEGDFRERVRLERENRRLEGQVVGAMKVAERLDTEAEAEGRAQTQTPEVEGQDAREKENEDGDEPDHAGRSVRRTPNVKPTRQINILWRGLVRQREEKERERRIRYDLHQSLSRLPTYTDVEEDNDDKRALGRSAPSSPRKILDDQEEEQDDNRVGGKPARLVLEEDVEEEDPELDEFLALEPAERLRRLVEYLREKYHYCFWCKFRYPDPEMEGCPGITEDEHG